MTHLIYLQASTGILPSPHPNIIEMTSSLFFPPPPKSDEFAPLHTQKGKQTKQLHCKDHISISLCIRGRLQVKLKSQNEKDTLHFDSPF